ncbi:MAG TPA: ABC transporter permease subunit [Solirubrobacteraceae bacterium]|nr:ABC transporter permease subunit [Solirubrobacteraceae bacterium]
MRRLPSAEGRAELAFGAVAVGVLAFVLAMLVTVFVEAWPSFAHNGYIKWFFPGGDVDQQLKAIINSPTDPAHYNYHLRAWPLLWDTALTTGIAVVLGLALSLLSAIFIVEFAPQSVKRVLEPVVQLLAAVPSVIFGLIGILLIVPWVNEHLISQGRKLSVAYVVQLNGAGLLVASLILMVMIVPIMVAITVNALAAVPNAWTEGSAALGVNRWRTIWRVSVRTARPAIVAGAVLASARALGEAIMLALVGGSRSFSVNLLDGPTALFEPVRPLAATIITYKDNLTVVPMKQTLYAMAAVVLVSAAVLSLAAWAVKQPLKRYGIRT